MKKRDETILDYLHKKCLFITSNATQSDINLENVLSKIEQLGKNECLEYYKSITKIAVLYNYIITRNNIFFGCANLFKLFSDELEGSDLNPILVAHFLLNLVEEYPETLLKYNQKNVFDYIQLMEQFLGEYFTLTDFTEFCSGNLKNTHDKIVHNGNDMEEKLNRKNLNVCYNSKEVNDAIKVIKRSYFARRGEFTKEDIEAIYESFIDLHVSQIFAQEIKNILIDKYNKRMNNAFSYTPKQRTTQPKKTLLSDKEYRAIVKEIKKYYDLHSWKLVAEEITSEEREHVASLMVCIGVNQEQLANFLKKSEKVSKTYTYDYFKDHVEEFKFYFGEELNQVFEYMKEMETCIDEEDKEYWIMGINEELEKLKYKNKLDSYEYEAKLMKEVQK